MRLARRAPAGHAVRVGWYDLFSRFYDSSLEPLYREAREEAAGALELGGAERVLDLPVGTGQSLDAIVARLPASGRVLGVDLSSGMLARAEERAVARGYADRVALRQADVAELSAALIEDALGAPRVDRLHVFLGLTAFPDPHAAFERLWDRLEPGGVAAVIDVHAERPGLQGRMVNLVARADITRRAWEPLEARAEGFARVELPPNPRYGGALWLATGRKPAA